VNESHRERMRRQSYKEGGPKTSTNTGPQDEHPWQEHLGTTRKKKKIGAGKTAHKTHLGRETGKKITGVKRWRETVFRQSRGKKRVPYEKSRIGVGLIQNKPKKRRFESQLARIEKGVLRERGMSRDTGALMDRLNLLNQGKGKFLSEQRVGVFDWTRGEGPLQAKKPRLEIGVQESKEFRMSAYSLVLKPKKQKLRIESRGGLIGQKNLLR